MLPEVLHDLDVHQPKLVLLTFECVPTSHDFEGCEQGPPIELKDYLAAHYRHDGNVEYADFYVRVDSASSSQLSLPEGTGGQSP
jgi:hypothetical protein